MLVPIRILTVPLLFFIVFPAVAARAAFGDPATQVSPWLGPVLVAEFELQSGQLSNAARLVFAGCTFSAWECRSR